MNSKFKIKKFLKLCLQVTFYSLGFYILVLILKLEEFNIGYLIEYVFPVIYRVYWFVTAYVLMYLLSPFINNMIKHMSKKSLKTLLILLTIVLTIQDVLIGGEGFYSDILMFVYFYLIAAYIRIYDISFKKDKKWLLLIILGLYLFMVSLALLLVHLKVERAIALSHYNSLSIPMLAISIATFLFFKNLKIEKNAIIAFLAKGTFGVYLVHENPCARRLIFKVLVGISDYYFVETPKLIVHVLGWATIIFVSSIIIDTLRRKLLEEPLFKLKFLDNFFAKIDKRMNLEE